MANSPGSISAKFCPRCGAFYNDLRSKTCPQCFAPLEILSDEDAESLTFEQEARRRDPEAAPQKAAEDEKYKEQAFAGCLGVIGILAITLILSVVIIYVGAHRRHATPTVHTGLSGGATIWPSARHTELAGGKLISDQPLSIGLDMEPAYYDKFGNGIDLYGAPASLSTADLREFRRDADDSEDLKPGIHTRKEFVAGDVDYVLFAPTDQLSDQAAKELTH